MASQPVPTRRGRVRLPGFTRFASLAVIALATTGAMAAASAPGGEEQTPGITMNGADFLAACSMPSGDWTAFCDGYVQAAFDALSMPAAPVCAPVTLTRDQIVDAVVRSIAASPALLAINAAAIVYDVLQKAFPCQ